MTWSNYGRAWHVDHRVACAQFNLSELKQQFLCFHWSNLQPMWALENIRKGKRLMEEHQFQLFLESQSGTGK